MFDPAYDETARKSYFLRELSAKFSTPVQPNEEVFDYLLTQFVCEYLSEVVDPPLDGVIFKSTQNKNGLNVALFQRALSVEKWDVKTGSTYDLNHEYDEDEDEPSINLMRTIGKYTDEEITNFPHIEEKNIPRAVLKICIENISVERVDSVVYKSSSTKVKISEYDNNKSYEF